MDELTALPGVGRKTANVVLSQRVQNLRRHRGRHPRHPRLHRLGLTANDDAEKIEQDLMALIPKKEWTNFSHRLIAHGRTICIARKPKCAQCALNDLCPSAEEPLE